VITKSDLEHHLFALAIKRGGKLFTVESFFSLKVDKEKFKKLKQMVIRIFCTATWNQINFLGFAKKF
jgi:hypothetical protein